MTSKMALFLQVHTSNHEIINACMFTYMCIHTNIPYTYRVFLVPIYRNLQFY